LISGVSGWSRILSIVNIREREKRNSYPRSGIGLETQCEGTAELNVQRERKARRPESLVCNRCCTKDGPPFLR
jgi:hypothetical protein